MEKADYQTSWPKVLSVFVAFLVVIFFIDPFLKGLGDFALIAQEIFAITFALLLNSFWIHQPLHFKTDVSLKTILEVNSLPILFVILAIIITFAKNNIDNFQSAITVAICAGVTEELVFRGIILPGSMTHFSGHKGMWYAVIISSLLFGGIHMVNLASQQLEATLLQGSNAFAAGLLLAAIYLRTRSLFFPMIFHGVNDYISTIVAHGSIIVQNRSFTPFIGQWILYLVLAIFLLRKSKTQDIYKITKKELF